MNKSELQNVRLIDKKSVNIKPKGEKIPKVHLAKKHPATELQILLLYITCYYVGNYSSLLLCILRMV